MKQITIILTCYKQERFIEETILSVINQNFKNRELLIWDDSPDDNCRKIISKYVNKYPEKIKAWHHKPNKWIVNNMQFLLDQRNKESEYVAFLEWDDCLFSEYLEKKLNIFTKYPNVQLVYNELTTINEESEIIEKKYLKWHAKCFYKKGKMPYDKLVSETIYVSRSTLMVRSENINKYKLVPSFISDHIIISDIYFFNQIAHNEDIYWIEDSLIYYRISNSSVSKSVTWGIKYFLQLIEYYTYLLNQWWISESTFKEQTNRRYLLISTASMKKSLSLWIFSTARIFLSEYIVAIKAKLRNLFK